MKLRRPAASWRSMLAILAAPTLHMNLLGAVLIVVFGFLFVTVSSRLTGEIGSSSNPISGMTVATLLLTCPDLPGRSAGPARLLRDGALGGRHRVHRRLQRGRHLPGPEDRLPGRAPRRAISRSPSSSARRPARCCWARSCCCSTTPPPSMCPRRSVAPGPAMPRQTRSFGRPERLRGPQAGEDTARVPRLAKDRHRRRAAGQVPGGRVRRRPCGWSIPGINGAFKTRPDGTEVRKFDAPKATLMSYIIKGMLDRKLPWGLVLFGVMIAVVLELSGVSSLAFAVGVYLPISSSAPLFRRRTGALVRGLSPAPPTAREHTWMRPNWLGGKRQKPRRAAGQRLHRRRRHRRHHHRVHGGRAGTGLILPSRNGPPPTTRSSPAPSPTGWPSCRLRP